MSIYDSDDDENSSYLFNSKNGSIDDPVTDTDFRLSSRRPSTPNNCTTLCHSICKRHRNIIICVLLCLVSVVAIAVAVSSSSTAKVPGSAPGNGDLACAVPTSVECEEWLRQSLDYSLTTLSNIDSACLAVHGAAAVSRQGAAQLARHLAAYRLPTSTDEDASLLSTTPTTYSVNLSFTEHLSRYSGTARIQFAPLSLDPAQSGPAALVLHAQDGLELTSISLVDAGDCIPLVGFLRNSSTSVLTLLFGHRPTTTSPELHLAFTSAVRYDSLAGLYGSTIAADRLAVTQFEAVDARRAFPCFDEPALKAVFDLTLTVPDAYAAGTRSNMHVVSTTPAAPGFTTVSFASSPAMSTYLVAVLVSKLVPVSRDALGGRLNLSAWTTPESAHELDLALSAGAACLSEYEDFFDVPFPLDKMDMAAIPDFSAGAMENWGLVTYRQTALLFDPAHSTTADEMRVFAVVAHELAHQWFGNLVTMAWWNDLWLNEGFATFVENYALDTLGDYDGFAQATYNDLLAGLRRDSLVSTHPLHAATPPQTPREIEEMFDSISYSKGGSILRMFYEVMGHDTFRARVHSYLTSHAYGPASTEEFFEALGRPEFLPWATQAGYPLVTLTRHNNTHYTASQRHFVARTGAGAGTCLPPAAVRSDTDDEPSSDQVWWVPLWVKGDGDAQRRLIPFAGRSSEPFPLAPLSFSGGYVIGNAGRSGFYRVAYDSADLAALAAAVGSRGIGDEPGAVSGVDLAGTLDDLWALGRTGDCDALASFVQLARAVADHGEATPAGDLTGAALGPWKVILGHLLGAYRLAVGASSPAATPIRDLLDRLVRAHVAVAIGAVDDGSHASLSFTTRLLHSDLLSYAVAIADDQATPWALNLFATNGSSFLLPDAQQAVFAAVAASDDDDAYRTLVARFSSPGEDKYPGEKRRLLRAVSSREAALGAAAASLSLDGAPADPPFVVRSQDLVTLMHAVATSCVGTCTTVPFNWVRDNFDALLTVDSGAFTLAVGILEASTSYFATSAQLAAVRSLVAAHQADIGPSSAAFLNEVIEERVALVHYLETAFE